MKGLDSEATYTRESGGNGVYVLAYLFYQLRVNFSLDMVAPAIAWTQRLCRAYHIRRAIFLGRMHWQHQVSDESKINQSRETPWIAIGYGLSLEE